MYILQNGKELKRPKWVKNKISQTKVAAIHRRMLAILFDLTERTISKQFTQQKLALRNPYAVKKYIIDRINKNWSFWPEPREKKIKTKKSLVN